MENINPNEELQERLRFETLIADLSSKFINVPAGDVDREIMDTLRHICVLLGLDLLALWQWSDEAPGFFALTHLYSAQEGSLPPGQISQEDYPWVRQQLAAGRIVIVASLNGLPAEASRDRETSIRLGIKSNLSLPLSVGGKRPIGAFCLNSMKAERDWPDALVKRLQLIAQIFTNALARKRADQDLRESEARLAAGTDLAGLGYYEADYGERSCFLDERFRDICGVPPELQQGFRPVEFWMEHVHPDDLKYVLDERQKLHDGRLDRISTEYRYQHPARGQRWVHHLARIAGRNAARQGVRTFGVVRDITETKQLSEQLQSAAEEWQTTFDSINDQVMILDREGRTVRANAATMRFFGRPMETLVGSLCCALMHGANHPLEGCPSQRTIRTGMNSKLEMFHAGSGKWLLISTDPIRDTAGNVIGAVHVARDITEAKRAERETRELRDNLMHLTRVNTMSVLSGSLAHELNQPLGIILTNAQAAQDLLLQEPPDVTEVQSILTDIVAADRRAGEVIERLRALLKPGHIFLQALPLNGVIEEVLHLINADLIGRGVHVVRDLDPNLPPIAGDRIQLQQLVLNLILNGADAMAANAPGARRLLVQTKRHQERVRISVQDEGCGLSPNVEQLFQPFYTTKPQGLGMGLAICRAIADAHRGRLWAEPHPERGAVFHFELPIAGPQEER